MYLPFMAEKKQSKKTNILTPPDWLLRVPFFPDSELSSVFPLNRPLEPSSLTALANLEPLD